MIYAYDDEDNAPMWVDLPLPYPIRTWDEMVKAWEGEHNADGQGQISGILEAHCADEPEGRLEHEQEIRRFMASGVPR